LEALLPPHSLHPLALTPSSLASQQRRDPPVTPPTRTARQVALQSGLDYLGRVTYEWIAGWPNAETNEVEEVAPTMLRAG